MPAFREVLLVLSRPLVVASLTACFVLFQTVPVLVTGGGWEEEVASRAVACQTIGLLPLFVFTPVPQSSILRLSPLCPCVLGAATGSSA